MITRISGKRITVVHVDGPQGVRGRNSDNTQLRRVLAWEPSTSLEDGLEKTYEWIAEQVEPVVRALAATA
jgi:GDP-D-mannose 3', 5'-epimerase